MGAGVIGAFLGTMGGAEMRGRLARAFGKDLPAALLEDAVAIGGAFLIVSRLRVTAHFDAIIIGTGQAGPFLAGRLAESGLKVAIVERNLFGGTCVNTGCTPTKTMVASAYAAHLARRAGEFGVTINGGVDRGHEAREGAEGRHRRGVAGRPSELAARHEELHRLRRPRAV